MTASQSRTMRPCLALLAAFALLAWASVAVGGPSGDASRSRRSEGRAKADGGTTQTPKKRTPPRKKKGNGGAVSPQREAAVLAFVRKNHPDLTALLAYLKDQRPREYARAIRQMYPVSERLAKLRKNDSERYEVALQSWKVQSRVQLLAAQAKMSDDPAIRQNLEKALREQIDLRCELLARDRDKFLARAEKFESQRKHLEAQRETSVARQLKMLLRKEKPAKNKTPSKKGAQKKTSPKKGAAK